MDLLNDDATAIWAHIQREEKLLSKKRRWLMGASTISNPIKAKKQAYTSFFSNEFIEESLIRDEDVSRETVRMAVEKSFRAFTGKEGGIYVVKDYVEIFDLGRIHCDTRKSSKLLKIIISALDNLNTAGLSRLASILMRNTIEFEKTYPRMKKVVKTCLRKLLNSSNFSDYVEQLGDLLTNPCNFKVNTVTVVTLSSPSLISAANKILERLHDESTLVLQIMRRILADVPHLSFKKSYFARDQLLEEVRCRCNEILLGLKGGDELPKPLAIAMTLAGLSLRFRGVSDVFVPEFYHFPPQAESLQNEILKALVNLPKVNYVEMKDVQHILDPNGERTTKKFRMTTQKMLIRHLLQSGETDIPKSLLNALSLINRKSRRKLQFCLSKEKIEEEVECILNVSAQLKQIIWDMCPKQDFDEDYANAYMDDLDSEDSEWEFKDCSDLECVNSMTGKDVNMLSSSRLHLYGSHSDDEVESIADSRPVTSSTCSPIAERTGKNYNGDCSEGLKFGNNENCGIINSIGFGPPSCPQDLDIGQSKCNNYYLGIQEICDEASLVAHRLIGCLLDKFSLLEGMDLNTNTRSFLHSEASGLGDLPANRKSQVSSEVDTSMIFVRTVEELLPSFNKSGIELVKKLMKLE